jgi:hypothetical protein
MNIEHLPTATIKRRIDEIRQDIRAAHEDSSLRGGEREELLADLRGDLSRYREELENRTC